MDSFVYLAKSAVETHLKEGKTISPPDNLPEDLLKRKAGVFITIKKGKELRGCIGTYLSTEDNLAKEIIQNAITAATKDYRFKDIGKEELPDLSYTISILSEPEPVKDLKELDPKKYGIIVKTTEEPTKSALLLPDLEDIDTIEKQIAVTCQKGKINPLEEKVALFKFTVEKHE